MMLSTWVRKELELSSFNPSPVCSSANPPFYLCVCPFRVSVEESTALASPSCPCYRSHPSSSDATSQLVDRAFTVTILQVGRFARHTFAGDNVTGGPVFVIVAVLFIVRK